VTGSGHSGTFQDKYGNYWHITTLTISQKHMFERRLGLFPAFFDKDNVFYTYTGFGDFPMMIPKKKISGPEELFPGWMLLSYHKPVEVSSEEPNFKKSYATDEEIRTFWSAQTGNKGEWISVDLQNESHVNAIQLNFAENQTHFLDRSPEIFYQYLLECSDDAKTWITLADKTSNQSDVPHDYIELPVPVKTRFIRLTNYHVPGGTFAISGFRIFGIGKGSKPEIPGNIDVNRTLSDRREVKLSWKGNTDATGYNIRYGTQSDKLYLNYQVFDKDSITFRSLNSGQGYFFTIDAFNQNGISKGIDIVEAN
jgi:xylan 1,4-beta-xylosidase